MPIKSFLKKLDTYQIIIGIFGGIICYVALFHGINFIVDHFSLPPGHPLTGTLLILLPSICGIIVYSISTGNHPQRITYLLLGGISLLCSIVIPAAISPNKDPIYSFLPFALGIAAGILYFLGGVFTLLIEVSTNYLKKLNQTLQRTR